MYSAWSVVFLWLLFFYSGFVCAELQDPTEPSTYHAEISNAKEPAVITTFVLDATVISEDNKFAIINDNIVKIGDLIGGKKVKSIDPYSVTLVGEQGEVVLHLFGSPIKESKK